MLRALRLRLTMLYLAASLGLVLLLGAGTYGLLSLYFLRSTDQALQYRMATVFQARGLTLPVELASALQTWGQTGSHPSATFTPLASLPGLSDEENEGEQGSLPAGERFKLQLRARQTIVMTAAWRRFLSFQR